MVRVATGSDSDSVRKSIVCAYWQKPWTEFLSGPIIRRALHASEVEVAEGRVRLVRASALVYSSRSWVKKPCGFDFVHMKQVGFGIDCPGDEYRLPGKISSFLLIVQ
jgi:hypothetical protein